MREGLDGHIELDLLRELWQPISPANFIERVRGRQTLLVYARYDLTFPVDLSRSWCASSNDRTFRTKWRCSAAGTTRLA